MNLENKNNTAYSEEKYGMARVIEPKFVLPTSAWSLDNNREISSRELRVSIRKIHLETTNFKQLQLECGDDDSKIKEKIIDIVIRRGKLHNPMTDTAGVLYGVVDEIGSEYVNEHGLKKGDEIICNLSLASIPLYISRITSISLPYSQIVAEGYAILYQGMPVIRVPEDAPIDLLLLMLDESGTLMTASQKAQGKNNILVVGNNIMVNMIYGYALRRVAGPNAEIVCLLDKRMTVHADGPATSNLLSEIFNELHYVDILRPIECMRRLDQESFFDMSVNCADIPGAETINILATKEGGTVIFANLINNYNISLYITEASSKHLELLSAVGYIEGYEDYDILLSRELAPAFDAMEFTVLRGSERNLFRASSKETRLLDSMARITTLAEDFICDSRAMQAILEEVTAVSKYDCNVFITGDTGVGKEKVANIIQKNSSRKIQPFIKVNCAAISPTLIESELFGYEKGAFTGANSSGKKGYFELADNGTIFLDEVGELPLDIQAKLLRVIQDGEFYKVGATKPTKINVRIICATNRNVEKMVEEKQFRRDLYYRLNVFPIRIPGLSDRKEDIPGLVHLFLSKYGELFHVTRDISEDAMEYLTNHEWPGNIRELENVMQRLLINARGETILLYDVTKELNQDLFDKEMGIDVGEGDVVEVNGSTVSADTRQVYYMLNKPTGYVTTLSDEKDRPIVTDLLTDVSERVFPVGRLDYNTSGLLLITNDGDLANKLMHPKHQVYKTYRAEVAGILSPERVAKLRKGVDIGGFVTSPANVKIIKQAKAYCTVEIQIREGKNRQVRKMFRAVGNKVVTLHRVAIGDLYLGRLMEGHYRKLTPDEVKYLKSL